ncbi:ABC transporter permease [Intrasporangium chromatireducens Q5-1]|uniref:ABC transporter permease n=1 Tax=Intrasporangium chromatireducens Q5-1 TaxID=584657 RepID=W9GRN5_9MICO|nr:branched-chain amino acid ABC transporter permease [Intrasporangium chromatireducens]EWT06514.1 ABC transporter permease [Intrasporangium chromatireducens Q5-1]
MELFASIVGGLLIGGLYVAISLGFSVAFGVLDVVDLAVGMWVVMGAYAAVVVQDWLDVDPLLLLPLYFLFFALVGAVLAPLIYRVRNNRYAMPALMGLALTFGFATIFRGSLLTGFGYTPRTVRTGLANTSWNIFGLVLPAERVAGFLTAAVLTLAFAWFLYFTRSGLAVRAVAQSKENAGLMGVDVKRTSTLIYALYTGLTAMCGAVMGAIYAMTPELGPRYTLFAFFVVVLAGLGSIWGVLVTGLLLGVLQSLVSTFWSADYTLLVVFLSLFVVLLLLPNGIGNRRSVA